jgi:hypothetical protein
MDLIQELQRKSAFLATFGMEFDLDSVDENDGPIVSGISVSSPVILITSPAVEPNNPKKEPKKFGTTADRRSPSKLRPFQ